MQTPALLFSLRLQMSKTPNQLICCTFVSLSVVYMKTVFIPEICTAFFKIYFGWVCYFALKDIEMGRGKSKPVRHILSNVGLFDFYWDNATHSVKAGMGNVLYNAVLFTECFWNAWERISRLGDVAPWLVRWCVICLVIAVTCRLFLKTSWKHWMSLKFGVRLH